MPNKKSKRNNKNKAQCPVINTPKKHTLYYFNGSTFPVFKIDDTYDFINKQSAEMIKNGIKHGVDKEEQIQDYTNQLVLIENLLQQHCNPYTEQGMNFICDVLDSNEDYIMMLWCLNICALLNLNALPNDNNNGVIHLTGDALKLFNAMHK